jgi:hypothetical protein
MRARGTTSPGSPPPRRSRWRIERWPSRRTLIVADDEPAPWRDVLTYVAAVAGAAPPAPGGRQGFPSFRVRNARAREALAWAPTYATYRAGLAR